MVKINGIETDIGEITLKEYLIQTGYSMQRIAVEINGEIVPKSMYETTLLKDGDTIEIVNFVGGG